MESIEPITIRRIKNKDLVRFAEQYLGAVKEGDIIPITMQRAIAHTHNPYSKDDDVALLLAYEGEECVGYFGIMPVLLKHGDQFSRLWWFTTWLVSPRMRGKSVGSLLMKDALSLDQDYLIVGSGPARKVCRKFGFLEFKPLEYALLDTTATLRINPLVWFSRAARKVLRSLGIKVEVQNLATRAYERLVSPVTRRVFLPWMERQFSRDLDEINPRQVEEIREETPEMARNLPDVCLYRGPEVVNWMLRFPWVLESGSAPGGPPGYYFSDQRAEFQQIALEICSADGESYLGYLVLSVSTFRGKRVLKVLDFQFNHRKDEKYILSLAMKVAVERQVDLLELPKSQSDRIRNNIVRWLLVHSKLRTYQCHPRSEDSPLGRCWQEIELNFCDGDMAFS